MDEDKTMPLDAWAIRRREWDARHGELLVGEWHRPSQWVRRGGIVGGIVTVCGRVYTPDEIQLVGQPKRAAFEQDQQCTSCIITAARNGLTLTEHYDKED